MLSGLQPQEHALLTEPHSFQCPMTLLGGGDSAAVLYAAYAWAETMGVRFMLHEDVLPDQLVCYHSVQTHVFIIRYHRGVFLRKHSEISMPITSTRDTCEYALTLTHTNA